MFTNLSIGVSYPQLYLKNAMIDLIHHHGGVHGVHGDRLHLLICSTSELSRETKIYHQALAQDVPIVSEDWFEAAISSGELPLVNQFPPQLCSSQSHCLSPILTLTSLAEKNLNPEQIHFVLSESDLKPPKHLPLPILSTAHSRQLPIVTTAWITESFTSKKLIDYSRHLLTPLYPTYNPEAKRSCLYSNVEPLDNPGFLFNILLSSHFKFPILEPRLLLALHWLLGTEEQSKMIWDRNKSMFGAFVDRYPGGLRVNFTGERLYYNCSKSRAMTDFKISESELNYLHGSNGKYNLIEVKELSLFKHGLEDYRRVRDRREKFLYRKQEIRDERVSYIHKYLRFTLNFRDFLWTSKIINSDYCSDFLANGKGKTNMKSQLNKIVFIYNLTKDCSDSDRDFVLERFRLTAEVTEEMVLREVRSLVWNRKYGNKGEYFTIKTQRSGFIAGLISDHDMENFMSNFRIERNLVKTLIHKVTANCSNAVRCSVFNRLQNIEIVTEQLIQEQMQEIINTSNEQSHTQLRAQRKAKKRARYKARKKAKKQAKLQSDLYTNFHN
ncbi:hypothetical protein GEMRC1_005295 [Eukaryota sp. GEM-RC1]